MLELITNGILRDLILIAPLHAANDLVFVLMRFRLLGGLHKKDSPVSKKLVGAHRTWLGLAVILFSVTAMYWILLGHLCIWPAIGMIMGVHASSALKRALGMQEGSALPPFDQLDFFLGGVAGLALCGFYLENFWLMLAITFALHLISNVTIYLAGLKEVWW